jgi:hypothetical protein
MLAVIMFVAMYLAGLIVFIFATIHVQWVWLGYGIYTMVAMHCYRFLGGADIATTESWLARELYEKGKVTLARSSKQWVLAEIKFDIAERAKIAKDKFEAKVKEIIEEGREEGN